METRLLRALVELDRLGTMRAVAESTGYGTSAVSQQFAALERELGAALVERSGRGVRLTWAGRRLAAHAERILAAEATARAALDRDAEPSGALRVAAYASGLSADVIPAARELRRTYPALRLELREHEPAEVVELLRADEVDLGFAYDYSLIPRFKDDHDGGDATRYLCSSGIILAVPGSVRAPAEIASAADLAGFATTPWVVNSRGVDDSELASRVCGLAGFVPDVAHHADSLDLVLDIVAAELGVALVPDFLAPRDGVRFVPLSIVDARRRMFALTRPGEQARRAVSVVVDLVGRYASRA